METYSSVVYVQQCIDTVNCRSSTNLDDPLPPASRRRQYMSQTLACYWCSSLLAMHAPTAATRARAKEQMPGGILDPVEHNLAIGDGTAFHRDFFLPGVFYTRLCKTELQNHAYMQRSLRSVQSCAAAAHA
eukprot:4082-Heterococcus_DN1.PRE.1